MKLNGNVDYAIRLIDMLHGFRLAQIVEQSIFADTAQKKSG